MNLRIIFIFSLNILNSNRFNLTRTIIKKNRVIIKERRVITDVLTNTLYPWYNVRIEMVEIDPYFDIISRS
jgi:hypothetical protein